MSDDVLRVVVGEDEAGSRRRLRQLIGRDPRLRLVAECLSGPETLNAIRRHDPDLVFLDVRMPGCTGVEVARAWRARRSETPVIVFVTAHEEFAARAFDLDAADYLLKPFDGARFERSIARVTARLAQQRGPAAPHPALPAARAAIFEAQQRIAIRDAETLRFLDAATITHVAAEDCYARVHADGRTYLVRESLASLSTRLPVSMFRRIHRSTIVNLAHVASVTPASHGDLRLQLSTGWRVRVSRRFRANVGSLLGR